MWKKKDDNGENKEEKRIDFKPLKVFYLEEAYEQLCNEVTLQVSVKDVNRDLAMEIKELLAKHSGTVPFNLRIFEKGGVFYADFFNFATKVNPESLLKDLDELSVNYNGELK